MKKLWLMMFLIGLLPFCLAEDADDDGGIMPDSLLYGLDKAFDRISLALTFGKAAKAEKALLISQERLVEAKVMAEQGKLREMESANEGHRLMMQNVQKNINELKEGNTQEKVREQMEVTARIQNRVEDHYQHVADILDGIIERQRERMSEEQIAKVEQAFNQAKERVRSAEDIGEQKREQVAEQYRRTGADEEQVQAARAMVEMASGLKEGRQERAEMAIQNAEQAMSRARERLTAEGIDLEDQLGETQRLIAEARAATERGEERDAREIAEQLKEFGNQISNIALQFRVAKENGTLEQERARLMETIREMHRVHMGEVLEIVPEEAKEGVRHAIRVMGSETEADGAGREAKPVEMPEGTKGISGEVKREVADVPVKPRIVETDETETANKQGSGEEPGRLDLQVSDAPADIGDFRSLEVTFSKARIFTADGFEERDLDNPKVDLTKVIDNPESVLVTELEPGRYNKIELHVANVEAVLKSTGYANEEDGGTEANVMVPSDRLQIVMPFEVASGETTVFVFDINVVRKGLTANYNLLPVIAKSGVRESE